MDFCHAMKFLNKSHPFMAALVESIQDSIASLMTGCPYYGNYSVNATVDDAKWPSILPSGMYKIQANFSLGKMLYLVMSVETEMRSEILTSF